MTEQSSNPRVLPDRMLVIDEARYLLSGEKPLGLNVAESFAEGGKL
jgi:hypothetical protein